MGKRTTVWLDYITSAQVVWLSFASKEKSYMHGRRKRMCFWKMSPTDMISKHRSQKIDCWNSSNSTASWHCTVIPRAVTLCPLTAISCIREKKNYVELKRPDYPWIDDVHSHQGTYQGKVCKHHRSEQSRLFNSAILGRISHAPPIITNDCFRQADGSTSLPQVSASAYHKSIFLSAKCQSLKG